MPDPQLPLFDPGEHESLTSSAWEERRIHDGIAAIVTATTASFAEDRFRHAARA